MKKKSKYGLKVQRFKGSSLPAGRGLKPRTQNIEPYKGERLMNKLRITTLFIAMLFMLGIMASANTARASEDLAKQSQNPVSSLISVPFENNLNFNAGPEDKTDYILNIKPVIPMSFSKNWNLINRVIAPVMSQGERSPALGRIFGLGDITYQGFFSPAKPGKIVWGVGPQLGMPTGMDRLTSNQWTLGPAVVVLAMPGHWVVGTLVSNFWSIGDGYDDAPDVNVFSAQYFINYNMKGGWYLTSTPIITANWEADDDNTWTVPFGGGVGRVFKMGKQHINAKLAGYYNVEKPDNASDWTLQAQITLMFPKKK